jgi:hypothetical protein
MLLLLLNMLDDDLHLTGTRRDPAVGLNENYKIQ